MQGHRRHVAAAAGLEILSKGGNATIGGDTFTLYFDAQTKQVSAINGSGHAPAALTLERLKKEGITSAELPMFHAHTVTVPGARARRKPLWM